MVKKIVLILSLVLFISCSNRVEFRKDVATFLMPKPIELIQKKGFFTIDSKTKILASKNLENEANYLSDIIKASSNFTVEVVLATDSLSTNSNIILLEENLNLTGESQSDESYGLIITKSSIKIDAGSSTGIMRGIQTLRQLFVNDFHKKNKKDSWYLPLLEIKDKPAFKHRGMLFDSGRHFFETTTVKKYIDLLAFYKMNVFHWHLTEDQGWRLAIDKYPKLTSIAAFRTQKDGSTYGGFYTKEQIKEIVAYATERHITIIPEIELPGHSQAALAAYPELSCIGGNDIKVANDWGVFKEIYCAGNEQTFVFLENVLTEVMELFPSEYIHIGGDEAPKTRWAQCVKCQKRIKDESLHDEHGLQSYFIKRIEKFLNKNNRKLIGWDEILEGGLSPTATVQSWRGEQGGITAANNNQFAIMSPTSHCYFDYGIETTDLEKVYSFNPIPKDLPLNKHQFILGSECNLWSERIPTEERLDQMTFPRLLAMSEVLWSYPKERNFENFYDRVQNQYPLLEAKNVNYGIAFIPVRIEEAIKDKTLQIKVSPKDESFTARYRWNCADCDTIFKNVSNVLTLNKTAELEVEIINKGKPDGANTKRKYKYHKAIGSTISYVNKYSDSYKASGMGSLADGQLGSLKFRDGNWQGFFGDDLVCTVDLGKKTTVTEIGTHFFHRQKSWILTPKQIIFETSVDGITWVEWAVLKSQINPKNEDNLIEEFSEKMEERTIRYIKLSVKNIKSLPKWHEAEGSKGWLFIDEIFVN